MKRTLLTLVLMAAGAATAGAALAQTSPAPVTGPATGNAAGGVSGAGISPPLGANASINDSVMTNVKTGPQTDVANAPPTQRLTGPASTAKRRIEQDGYKSVENVQKGDDGLWHGTAMRGGSQVQVTVDRAGRVSVQ